MGTVGSSVGVEAAEKFTENTYEVMEKLKIPESARNLTELFHKLINPTEPFELKVNVDVSPNVVNLVEKFLYLIPVMFIIIMFIIIFAIVLLLQICKCFISCYFKHFEFC